MRVSHHSNPDGPVPTKLPATTVEEIPAHHPIPKGPLRIAVSDGSITIFVTGCLRDQQAVESLCHELRFATSVCRGVVTVDLTDCTGLSAEATQALRTYHHAARSSEFRYQLRIIAGRPSAVRTLAAGGVQIEHDARRSGPGSDNNMPSRQGAANWTF